MKQLIDSLERACSHSAELREMLYKLKQEMEAARENLTIIDQR